MNGAETLVRTLLASGVDTCFTNPGTSEMHFVAALDSVPGMRCVLGLFEGVVTGAADGYARMTGKPAATLLHLGPGLGNGFANLHNARKARSPMVNVVGEHATYHLRWETPLRTDIEAIASTCSDWVRTSRNAQTVAADAAAAVAHARSGGRIATLILPADCAWDEAYGPCEPVAPPALARPGADTVREASRRLARGASATLMLSGPVLVEPWLSLAAAISAKTGCRLLSQQSNARVRRGRGHADVPRMPYPVPQALAALAEVRDLVLLGAHPPASFFAYPGQPSLMTPSGCEIFTLASREDDAIAALEALAAEVGAKPAGTSRGAASAAAAPGMPSGELDGDKVMRTVAALLPEDAVLCDESVTSGRRLFDYTSQAAPHDYLQLTGGAIGIGSPLALGAAIGAPGRRVVSLQADGSTMYTLQGLWSQARENLPITTVILANRAYRILQGELAAVGAGTPGERARQMLSLDEPTIDWVSLARGMGIEGTRVRTVDELADAIKRALQVQGPVLIEAWLP